MQASFHLPRYLSPREKKESLIGIKAITNSLARQFCLLTFTVFFLSFGSYISVAFFSYFSILSIILVHYLYI